MFVKITIEQNRIVPEKGSSALRELADARLLHGPRERSRTVCEGADRGFQAFSQRGGTA